MNTPHPTGNTRRANFRTLLLAAVLLPLVATADAPEPLLLQHVVASGAGNFSGGGFTVQGTFGQESTGTMTGGGFTVVTGFWAYKPTTTPAMPLQVILGQLPATPADDVNADGVVDAADL